MAILMLPFYSKSEQEPGAERPSLEQCAQEMRARANALDGAYEGLRLAYDRMREPGQIWPEQCDQLGFAVRRFSIQLDILCMLLDDAATLPEAVIPARYQLVLSMHHSTEQARRVMPQIQVLRASCRARPNQALQQRRQLLRELDALVRDAEDLRWQCTAVMDRARFQERALHYQDI